MQPRIEADARGNLIVKHLQDRNLLCVGGGKSGELQNTANQAVFLKEQLMPVEKNVAGGKLEKNLFSVKKEPHYADVKG